MNVGTLPWLLRHELRLWWRDLRGKWFLLALGLILGSLIAVSVGLMVFSLTQFSSNPLRSLFNPIPQPVLWTALVFWLYGFCFGFIQAMQQSVVVLFDRGDLDLLVSSPISSKVVFASRVLSIAIELFLGFCPYVVPITLIFLAAGFAQVLGVYPALIGLSLIATSLAMILTNTLVKLMGARRARTMAQVLGSLLGVSLFVVLQLLSLSGAELPPNLLEGTGSWGLFSRESWIWFPAKTIFFDLPSVVLMLTLSAVLTWVTVEALHRSFVQGTQQTVTGTRRSLHSQQAFQFQSNLNRLILNKEWRLMRRNPFLISRGILPLVFIIPVGVGFVRNANGTDSMAMSAIAGAGGTVLSVSLVSVLAILCFAAEEAPDLLKSSPIPGQQLRRLKLLAVLVPTWVGLSFIPLLLLSQGIPLLNVALVTLTLLVSSTCTTVLRLWNMRPLSLSGMMARRWQNPNNDVLLSAIEFIALYLWIFLGFQAGQGRVGACGVGLVAIAGLMAIAYARSRALGSTLGF